MPSRQMDGAIRILLCHYQEQEANIRAVREQVFIYEQKVDREEEFDGRDEICEHAIAFCENQPVGTARLDLQEGGKLGRMAVLSEFRRQGIGTALLNILEMFATEVKLSEIWFHAQTSAIPFYQTLGYKAEGEEFLEANIRHYRMRKSLR